MRLPHSKLTEAQTERLLEHFVAGTTLADQYMVEEVSPAAVRLIDLPLRVRHTLLLPESF